MNHLPSNAKLKAYASGISRKPLSALFDEDPERAEKFHIRTGNLLFDFSKNQIDGEVFHALIDLAKQAGVEEKRDAMFAGEKINFTEDRAVLHIALRRNPAKPLPVNGENVMKKVSETLRRMGEFSEKVRSGNWKGHGGKAIKLIVNIGIGGSDLGANMACQALEPYAKKDFGFRFVSNVDPENLAEALKNADAGETLFIVASKTFTTSETLANAEAAKAWLKSELGGNADVSRHFAALSVNLDKTSAFGIPAENVFPFWNWVGGRFSICSAVGLSLMIAVGSEKFSELLRGFEEADDHFRSSALSFNIPAVMALLGVWHRNYLGYSSQGVIPYSHGLRRFPAYLQQAEMESNGKSVGENGLRVEWQTSPVIWGEPGTNAQHAFFQMLHQGTTVTPCDFIGFVRGRAGKKSMHALLMSNFFAQQEALAFGKKYVANADSESDRRLAPHRSFEGNRPSTCLLFDELTPKTLGFLIGLYEHKIFVQGAIWGINSFDQWGVELGKKLAGKILENLNGENPEAGRDPSTATQIDFYLNHRETREPPAN